jgi:3-oxoacyl-(acyl-carrier-protein) synthase
VRVSWAALGAEPARVPWKRIFAAPFPDFRRLDPLSRFCCIAAEAAGIGPHLPEAARARTALVLATTLGCLHADRRFERSLAPGAPIEPAVFPYTLPSTCLGELAIRHRLAGPTLCLSTEAGGEATGLEEARALIGMGEADAALVCMGDAVPGERLAMAALLLVPGEPRAGDPDPEAFLP